MNISDEIKRLHELHQAGALSDAEFAQAKARLLAGVNLDKPGDSANRDSGRNLVEQFSALRRSRSDRWLGGVCGGLARISGLDSWIWRLLFALFALTFGFGLVIYILLWIFVPDEETRN
jgi:phage shock protein C